MTIEVFDSTNKTVLWPMDFFLLTFNEKSNERLQKIVCRIFFIECQPFSLVECSNRKFVQWTQHYFVRKNFYICQFWISIYSLRSRQVRRNRLRHSTGWRNAGSYEVLTTTRTCRGKTTSWKVLKKLTSVIIKLNYTNFFNIRRAVCQLAMIIPVFVRWLWQVHHLATFCHKHRHAAGFNLVQCRHLTFVVRQILLMPSF